MGRHAHIYHPFLYEFPYRSQLNSTLVFRAGVAVSICASDYALKKDTDCKKVFTRH